MYVTGTNEHHTIIKSPKQMKRNSYEKVLCCFGRQQYHNHKKKHKNFSHKIFINNYKLSFFACFCLPNRLSSRKNSPWHHSAQSNRIRILFFCRQSNNKLFDIVLSILNRFTRERFDTHKKLYSEKSARTNLKFDPCLMKDKFKLNSTSEIFFLFPKQIPVCCLDAMIKFCAVVPHTTTFSTPGLLLVCLLEKCP